MRLEPLEPRHADELWAIAQDPPTWRWMRISGHESRELFDTWLASVDMGFAHYLDGELVGHTSFLNDRPADRVVEIGNTWVGMVGPGIQRNGVDSTTWTDHTNLRPTILALTGLKDDYVDDGH